MGLRRAAHGQTRRRAAGGDGHRETPSLRRLVLWRDLLLARNNCRVKRGANIFSQEPSSP
ncbi:hypothetical protein STAFG_2228 [Streptomyces afghaniensis 772]|uniref:Uncharacterized protein n=1 Tax=Streptomyces afghaniensis 772 TaxID=1283301 RepID=S4MMC4_9ACTN|nr:hypothetical protein STAFG_2228 [Streptomyces afghaniensis 772]